MTLDSLIARIRVRGGKFYPSARTVRWVSLVLACGFLVASWFLWRSFNQLIPLPKPGGSHSVGRQLFDWNDSSRKRELMVFVWYPAAPGTPGKRSEYLPREWGHRAKVRSGVVVSAMENAPPLSGNHPTLVLSPGMGRIPTDYTALAEDLASYGYIVIGITPPGSARVVVFSGGRAIYGHDGVDLEHRELAQPLIANWVGDFTFTLDHILTEPVFRGNIDEARIGIVGHSFGGAAAVHALRADRRFQRAANLDGAPEGHDVILDRPALFLLGTPLGPEQQVLNDKIYLEIVTSCNADKAGCHIENYPGAGHMNFSDAGLLPKYFWQRHTELTSIDAPAFLRTVSERLRLFFSAM